MTTWPARYQRFWDESHERLDELLAALQASRDDASGHGDAVQEERPSEGNGDE